MESKNRVHAEVQTLDSKNRYKKITSKSWQVYYYLLSISKFDSQTTEDHRFVYKNDFNISQTAKFLGISRPTIYSALKRLEEAHLIFENTNSYAIYCSCFVQIELNTLKKLIAMSKGNPLNIDLLRVYLSLKKLDEITNSSGQRSFTKRSLISILGYDVTYTEHYYRMRDYIALLSYLGLIEVKSHVENDPKLGHYTIYHLQKVNETSSHPDFDYCIEEAEKVNDPIPPEVREKITFQMPNLMQ